LYRPADGERTPLVIMAHGLGAVREMRLDAYAERFAQEGLAALVFDYRHFGASGGEPRQLLDIEHQLADWAAALAYARDLPHVDPGRIALWGSSFGGGHVLEAAARDARSSGFPPIAAVVSQCPFTDGPASLLAIPLRTTVKLVGLGLRDAVGSALGRPPRLIPLAGPPGSGALMTAPDAERGYRALIPPGFRHEGGVAARIGLRVGSYRPGRAARRLQCPVLFCLCDKDSVAPAKKSARYAAQVPRAEIKNYPIGHFDIYVGEDFERAVADQAGFLRRHLVDQAASE
jgi:dienelactone hydrolase